LIEKDPIHLLQEENADFKGETVNINENYLVELKDEEE
jgi:hypothetical protein